LLNSASKFKARVLPSLLEYPAKNDGKLPPRLSFSLAAWMMVYRNGELTQGVMSAKRDKGEFVMQDDAAVLKFFADIWDGFDGSAAAATEITRKVLGANLLWGKDLTTIPGLVEAVAGYIAAIERDGIQKVMATLVEA
jgi:tagaturonate reductase